MKSINDRAEWPAKPNVTKIATDHASVPSDLPPDDHGLLPVINGARRHSLAVRFIKAHIAHLHSGPQR